MEGKINWGVLGFASIARDYVISAILKEKNSNLYAIASKNLDHREQCEKLYKNVKVYSSYDEILEDPEVQAVYIPLPNALHKDWVLKAIQNNKHVLCEKPLTLTEMDVREIINACRGMKVIVMEAFMYRYNERIIALKRLLKEGVIGDIKCIHSSFGFKVEVENSIQMNPDLGGGSLYDVGCYPINLLGYLLEDMPINAASSSIVEQGVDISFSAILQYKNDIVCTIHCGFNAYERACTEIVGTKGIIEVPNTFIYKENEPSLINIINDDGANVIQFEMEDH
ncbi:MAG: Gfo/Idh/MocA family protein [Clostridia bacterium]